MLHRMSLMGAGLEFFWQDPKRSDLRDSSRAEVYNVFTVDREPVEPVSCPTAKAQNRDILNQNKNRHTRSRIVREKFVDTTERITPPPQKMQFLTFETTDYQIHMYQHSSNFRFVTARRQEDKLQKPLNSLFIPSWVSARLTYINHLIALTDNYKNDLQDYNPTDFVLSPTKSRL